MIADVFVKIDSDRSDFITLGELLNYAYRSGALKAFLEPFPAQDQRMNEGQVSFERSSSDHVEATLDKLSTAEAIKGK